MRAIFEWGGSLGWTLVWVAIATCLWNGTLRPSTLRGRGFVCFGVFIVAAFGAVLTTIVSAAMTYVLLTGNRILRADGATGLVMIMVGWIVLLIAASAGFQAFRDRRGRRDLGFESRDPEGGAGVPARLDPDAPDLVGGAANSW